MTISKICIRQLCTIPFVASFIAYYALNVLHINRVCAPIHSSYMRTRTGVVLISRPVNCNLYWKNLYYLLAQCFQLHKSMLNPKKLSILFFEHILFRYWRMCVILGHLGSFFLFKMIYILWWVYAMRFLCQTSNYSQIFQKNQITQKWSKITIHFLYFRRRPSLSRAFQLSIYLSFSLSLLSLSLFPTQRPCFSNSKSCKLK
jgi:hypothetical protein